MSTKTTILTLPKEELVHPGNRACTGCGLSIAYRIGVKALGPDTILVVPPSCLTVLQGLFPVCSTKLPVLNVTFASTASAATGVLSALKAQGREHTKVVGWAGDGGTSDIGIQALSGAAERGDDFLFVAAETKATREITKAAKRDFGLPKERIKSQAYWLQPLKNGVQGTFNYVKCYGFMEGRVYRIALVNRDWLSNRLASVELPFAFTGTVPFRRLRPDNGSPWNTVESASFTGWVGGTASMAGSNLVASLPPCSFTVFTVTNENAVLRTLVAGRDGRGNYTHNPSGVYVDGTEVNFAAYPDDDAEFYGWSGCVTGAVKSVCLKMSEDEDLMAHFTPVPEPCMLVAAAILLLPAARRVFRG
mgnify:CR=1 FL=1